MVTKRKRSAMEGDYSHGGGCSAGNPEADVGVAGARAAERGAVGVDHRLHVLMNSARQDRIELFSAKQEDEAYDAIVRDELRKEKDFDDDLLELLHIKRAQLILKLLAFLSLNAQKSKRRNPQFVHKTRVYIEWTYSMRRLAREDVIRRDGKDMRPEWDISYHNSRCELMCAPEQDVVFCSRCGRR